MEQKPNQNAFVDHSPLYRALLKAGEAAFWTVLLNVVVAVTYYLSTNATIDWKQLGIFAAGAAAVGLLMAVSKYFKASRQPLLGQTIEALVDVVARRYGLTRPRSEEAAQALDERPAYLRRRTTNAEDQPRRKNPRADDWTTRPP